MKQFRILLCGLVAISLCATGALAAGDGDIKLRGAGKTRDALNAMQLKPYDQSIWSNLSNWNGTPFKPADGEGKVVMIVTWASWYPVSHRAMKAAEAVYQHYKDKGLIVVGVHNPRGFDAAAANVKELGVTFPFAEDKEGKFRAALLADQDPNVYLIDRAGQMRFAQVETASIPAATEMLVKETADYAKNINANAEAKRKAEEKEKWLTRDPSGLAPGEEVTVTFKEPDEDAYKAVRWPYLVGKIERDPLFNKIKNESPKLSNLPDDDWFPGKPSRAGKLTVLYFVDPQEVNTLHIVPTMNRLQDEYKRDVVVVCDVYKSGVGNGLGDNNNQGGNNDDAEKLKQRNISMIKSLMASRPVNHYLIPTKLQAENLEFSPGSIELARNVTSQDAILAVLLSTDNRIRWIGWAQDPDLKVAIDKVGAVDPAVVARRKAEAAKAGK